MAIMLGSLHEALVAANVPADKARAAAEEVAGFESQFTLIRADIAALRSEISLLKWMIGGVLALNVAMLARMVLA